MWDNRAAQLQFGRVALQRDRVDLTVVGFDQRSDLVCVAAAADAPDADVLVEKTNGGGFVTVVEMQN